MREARTPSATDRRRGVAMLTVLVALVALIGASALAIDGGMLWAARTQMQNAADAAALAGAQNLIDNSNPAAPVVTLSASEAAAIDQASRNSAVSTSSVNLLSSDISFGNWDLATRSFDSSVDLSNPDLVSAVDVVARLDTTTTGRVPAFMARVLGRDDFAVSARATAYLGYEGGMDPGEVELPIAIDCCKLAGSDCQQDYCSTIESDPPNPCGLETPQSEGATTVSCLEFHSTPEQNACWTVFDGHSSAVDADSLQDIVEDGNTNEVFAGMPVFLDNGDKTPVIGDIEARFEEEGVDRYAPVHSPPDPDSWVVKLPVVNCQTDTRCAKGDPGSIVGVVCFEIREVEATPGKIIRGRFLCQDDPLYTGCDTGPQRSGGINTGPRAELPLLVR
jgi:Flp pilus assembly protein TadG